MSHRSRLLKVVIDVPDGDHDRELAFWQAATGESFEANQHYGEYHSAMLRHGQFAVLVQRLEDGPARVHLDIHADDVEAEVARLERLGAERVAQVNVWWVMRDPAGLPFCVIPAYKGSLDDSNSALWE